MNGKMKLRPPASYTAPDSRAQINSNSLMHCSAKNAIIILQTWEDWEPQPEITELVIKANPREKVIVLTTSDTGQEKLSGIDAISSASSKSETEIVANKIIERLEKIINL